MSKHTNYNKMANQPKVENYTEPETNVQNTEPQEPTIEVIPGNVAHCVKLNIRNTPELSGDIVGVLDSGTEVEIFVNESTDTFFKIKAGDIEGYCMKMYID